MNKLSFTLQQNMFVGDSLNWRERYLTLDDIKHTWLLDEGMDWGNEFIIEQLIYSDQISWN